MQVIRHTLANKEGLHARPAGAIITTAKEFISDIELNYMGKTVSLKGSIFSLMGLGIKYDTEIEIKVSGPDEVQACNEIKGLIKELL